MHNQRTMFLFKMHSIGSVRPVPRASALASQWWNGQPRQHPPASEQPQPQPQPSQEPQKPDHTLPEEDVVVMIQEEEMVLVRKQEEQQLEEAAAPEEVAAPEEAAAPEPECTEPECTVSAPSKPTPKPKKKRK